MIELDRDIIKTNILSKFEEDWVKVVASRLNTKIVDARRTPHIQVSQKLTLS